MKAWLNRLSLRYKLTLAALAVEAVMLSFLIGNGVQLTRQALQEQADHRVQELAEILSVALLAPLSQQDDASVRDIAESVRHDSGLKMIEVRDSRNRIVHLTGNGGGEIDFRVTRPVDLAGQHYGEVSLVLSGAFIQEARAHYVKRSLIIAAAALLLTGILLALSAGAVIRRFDALTRASKRMAQGDLDIKLAGEGEDEIGQLIGTFNRMTESVRFNVARARENEARFHAIADYTHDLEFWLSPEGKLLWVNPSVKRMLGYSVDECMTDINFPTDVIHPEDRTAAEFQLHQALRGTLGQLANNPEEGAGQAKAWFAFRQLLRFFVVLAIIFLLVGQGWVNIFGLLLGLSTVVLTLMLAALYETFKLKNKEANPSHGTPHSIS